MLVLFDIGSTLLEGPSRGPGSRLAEAFGLSPSTQAEISDLLFQETYSGPDDLANRLSHEFSLPLPRVVGEVRSLWEAQIEEAYPLPGAQQALDMLLTAGHDIAFVSNIWQPFLEGFRRHFPAAYAAYPGYYSFRLGVSKPDASIFDMALKEWGGSPRDAVVIGDTYLNDIRPGVSLGTRTIWVLHRPEKERTSIARVLNGAEPSPDVTLENISQLSAQHLAGFLSL